MARRPKAQEPKKKLADEFPLLTEKLGQLEHQIIWSFAFSFDCIPQAFFDVNKSIKRFCKTHITTLDAFAWGCQSMDDIRRLGFTSATKLNVSNMGWFNDDCLRELARLKSKKGKESGEIIILSPLPQLTEIDVSFCSAVTSAGVKALVKGVGEQLKGFQWDSKHNQPNLGKKLKSIVKALSTAPALETLSLRLPCNISGRLTCFSGHKRLRSLFICFADVFPTPLPADLPELSELRIKVMPWSRLDWPSVVSLAYPKLEKLEIDDEGGNDEEIDLGSMPFTPLSSETLIEWCKNLPSLQSLEIHNISTLSDLNEEAGAARLVAYLETRSLA